MTEQEFRSEALRAMTMREACMTSVISEWWSGYGRGLRRAFHGEAFGTQAEHEMLLGLVYDEDVTRKARGLGYRAGLAHAGEGDAR